MRNARNTEAEKKRSVFAEKSFLKMVEAARPCLDDGKRELVTSTGPGTTLASENVVTVEDPVEDFVMVLYPLNEVTDSPLRVNTVIYLQL